MPCVLERCAAQQVRQLLPRPVYPKRASGSWRRSQAPDASAPDRPHVVPRTAIPPGPPIAPRVRFATRCCRPDRAPARPGRRRDLQLLSGECEHVGGDARGASSGRIVIVVGVAGLTPVFVAKQVCAVTAWRSCSSPISEPSRWRVESLAVRAAPATPPPSRWPPRSRNRAALRIGCRPSARGSLVRAGRRRTGGCRRPA